MDGEWQEIKAKKPKKKKPMPEEQKQAFTGGKNKKGELIAGAVQRVGGNKFGGGGDMYGAFENTNAASHIADLVDDYGEEDEFDNKIEIERVSQVCAQAIGEARNKANMTQSDLAKKVGEKTSVIVDIENASAPYNAQQITNIEKALGVKVPRGRKKHRGGKKR